MDYLIHKTHAISSLICIIDVLKHYFYIYITFCVAVFKTSPHAPLFLSFSGPCIHCQKARYTSTIIIIHLLKQSIWPFYWTKG